jgi:nucleolar MIF4G domain-containing protein 1
MWFFTPPSSAACTRSSELNSVFFISNRENMHGLLTPGTAAHFVQTLVLSYEQHYGKLSSTTDVTEPEGKECSNLLVLISELYNFQVISSILVFDVIRALLAGDLTEFNVELLLKVVRSKLLSPSHAIIYPNIWIIDSGQQLRQDDPSALKDIIQIVQGRVSTEDNGVMR